MSAIIFLDSDLYLLDVKTEKSIFKRERIIKRQKYITLKTKEIDHIIPHQSRLLHAGGTSQFLKHKLLMHEQLVFSKCLKFIMQSFK